MLGSMKSDALTPQYYVQLRKSFEEYDRDHPGHREDVVALVSALEEAARMEENVAYTKRHSRIYGLLRQALDEVYKTAPERMGAVLALVKDTCRDIAEMEWNDMTKTYQSR